MIFIRYSRDGIKDIRDFKDTEEYQDWCNRMKDLEANGLISEFAVEEYVDTEVE